MRSALLAGLVVAAIGGLAADAASARPQVGRSQYIARGDAICRRAITQTHAIGVVRSMQAWGGPAGTRLIAIDRASLAALTALAPPPADAATLHALLAGARATVAETASALVAARAGNGVAFRTRAGRVAVLTRRYQAGARAYGFRICSHWGS